MASGAAQVDTEFMLDPWRVQLLTPPLLVLNNFSGEDVATKLLATTFQSMFPSIDVSTVELGDLRRVCLIHRDSEGDMYVSLPKLSLRPPVAICPVAGTEIPTCNKLRTTLRHDHGTHRPCACWCCHRYLRHYELSVKPAGVSKSIKSLLKPKVPDLSKFNDVSEFVLRGGEGYESDASDMGESNKVELAQTLKGANLAASKSAIRLTEMGPRLSLSLLKVEEGFCGGEVLFHSHVRKTQEQMAAGKRKREKAVLLKAYRKAEQARNVEKKAADRAENRERSIAGHKAKHSTEDDDKDASADDDDDAAAAAAADSDEFDEDSGNAAEVSSDDDAEWYRREVGEEPEAGLFSRNKWRRDAGASGGKDKGKGGASARGGGGKDRDKGGSKGGSGKDRGKGKDADKRSGSKGGSAKKSGGSSSYFSGPKVKRKREGGGGGGGKAKRSRD
jgi:ribosome biogenesis protein SSF1/2